MKKPLISILFLFFTFLFNTVYAEIINKVVVTGNERVGKETVIVYGDIKVGKNYGPEEINDITKNLFETNFFENIEIKLNNGLLSINVKEYPVIHSVILEGEKAKKIKKAILERISLQEKSSFIKSQLANDTETVKRIYNSMGYNFASVESKIQKFDDNRLNLVFVVVPGLKTKISKINFIGNKKIKEKTLRDVIVSEENKFWKVLSKNTNFNLGNIELDKRLLKNHYKSSGYYDVNIVSSNAEIRQEGPQGLTEITYNIEAGQRYKIKSISLNVSPGLDKKKFTPLRKEFSKHIGKYYSPFKVKKLLSSLDSLIGFNELQFVEHSVNEILGEENIDIKINIFEGERLLVERINIKGNTVTDETVIRAELLLDEGDPFNKLKLDKSIAAIKSRQIFSEVTKQVYPGSSSNLKKILITVKEQPTGEIAAGAGLGTDGGSFSFTIKENNWMGRGVSVATFAEVTKTSVKGSLEVNNPNHNFSGNELYYNLSATQNDLPNSGYENSVYTVGAGTKYEQYNNIFIAPSVSLSHDDLIVLSTASSNLKKQAGTFTDLSFDYAVSYDVRDRRYQPTDGYITSFRQALPLYADAPFLLNEITFSKYHSINNDIITAAKFFTRTINGIGEEDVRLSKRINLPSRRLRGFEAGKIGPKDGVDYVGGNYASAVNLEARLPNLFPESTKTDIGFFLDAGNVWNVDYSDSVDDSNKIRSSVGAQLGWISPLGPMSFILAKDITKAETDVTQTFNFRLGTTF